MTFYFHKNQNMQPFQHKSEAIFCLTTTTLYVCELIHREKLKSHWNVNEKRKNLANLSLSVEIQNEKHIHQ